jgi:hypothetical protein
MTTYPNRLFKGWCSNEGNIRSNFLHYIISTVRIVYDSDGFIFKEEIKTLEEYFNIDNRSVDDPFYTIYGSFKFDFVRSALVIGEYENLTQAIDMAECLSGHKVQEYDIN